MTLRNLRAYTQNKDDTLSTVTPSDYETGKGANACLRKINLNVDIATQAELNEAFNLLSNAITATGTEWKQADVQLSNDLKDWTKGSELSGALHNEITAETNRATTAEEAIRADLSNNYKVSVSDAADQPSSFVYTIMQGESEAGTINVPKDMFVEGASFQGTVLILSVRGQDTPISTDLSGLVDVYTGGSTDDAVVSVDKDTNIITVTATEAIARVGTAEDLSTANTIYGAKKYAEEKAAAVAVSAEGETGDGALVSADDANNMITVGSTQKLKDAVAVAETAIQSVAGDNTYLTASTTDKAVTVSATDKLTSVVNVVETTSANWNAAETNAKTYTNEVSAALSTTLHNELTAETQARQTADTALSNAIDALSGSVNGASGDNYVNATVEDNTVKVSATDLTKGAVDKVASASATWDGALTSVAGGQTTYITVTASEKSANAQTISATAQIHTVTDAVAGTADGLAVASDVKGYVDGKITDLSVSAAGDAYVNATSTGKAITVTATDKLTAVVDKVEQTSATWDAAAPLTALEAEQTARADADTALGKRIDGLSATYASKTTVDNAATTLDGAAAVAAKDLSAYNDIDEIIQELEDLKAAVKAFAGTLKTA